jgi:hypothetical protein
MAALSLLSMTLSVKAMKKMITQKEENSEEENVKKMFINAISKENMKSVISKPVMKKLNTEGRKMS